MADDKPERSRRPFVVLLLAALGTGAWYAHSRWSARQPLELGGTVEVRSVQVASRVGGRVTQVLVREGDRVRGGQPLVQLERAELEARRDEAQGAVELAQAQLDRAQNGPRNTELAAAQARVQTAQAALSESARGPRREDIQRGRAQLAAAESQVRSAQLAFERAQSLLSSGAVSRADFDSAQTQLQSATGNRDAARSALDALEHGTRPEVVAQARARVAEASAQLENTRAGSREEDLRAARAQLAQARARLALAELNLREATVSAPRDCVVEALSLRPGDLLAPSQPAVTLVEDDQLFVRAYVPETQLGHLHVGDTVGFTVDTFGEHAFRATVQHINQVGEYNPRNLQTADERANQVFLVRLGVAEGRELLRAGMAASVRMPRRHP